MSWPEPLPGLVVRYSYLWRSEADLGREEGVKDRPCAIVLAARAEAGETIVYALPISHTSPMQSQFGVELPAATKEHLGLDAERSWIILTEMNVFAWPGPDLRFVAGRGPDSGAYGMLPPGLFRIVRDRFLALARTRKAAIVRRTE